MSKMMHRIVGSFAMAGMLFLTAGATPAPAGAVAHSSPAKTSPTHTPTHAIHLANPHLHGAKPIIEKRIARERIARHWIGHWSFNSWAILHRGTGTIEGEVHNAQGVPMPAVQMVLRHAHGGIIKNWNDKHITTTGPGGIFIMRNVRIGTYRVRGSRGKAAGASTVHVSGGAMAVASVKI